MNKPPAKERKQPLVRLDAADKEILDSLVAQMGESSPRVLHKALTRYKKELFFERLNKGYSQLKKDSTRWSALQEERNVFEGASGDGLDGLK